MENRALWLIQSESIIEFLSHIALLGVNSLRIYFISRHQQSYNQALIIMGRGGRARGGCRSPGEAYEVFIDSMVKYPFPPTLINGIYTFVGNEMSFKAQTEGGITASQTMPQINLTQMGMMTQPDVMMQESFMNGASTIIPGGIPMQEMMTPKCNQSALQQANITLVGSKAQSGSKCCYVLTVAAGCFIFPLCFICCTWWKKIVYPMYELTIDAYQSIANFLARAPNLMNLNLTIVDNSFDNQKARIIHDALARSRITGFTFNNRALNCNWKHNEADDFKTNMASIKSLNMSTSITWGDMIV